MEKPKSLGHKKQKRKRNNRSWRKKGTGEKYDTTAWRNLRNYKIQIDPVCELCEVKGFITTAKVVDHVRPINQGGSDDLDNLQSLCHSCHNRKTGRESRA